MSSSPQTQSADAGTVFEIPVAFVASHSITNPGFQSRLKGQFASNGSLISINPFHAHDIEVLGTKLKQLSLNHTSIEKYMLQIHFDNPMSMDDAQDYIIRLMDAFTVSMAANQRDPWYGNLLLEALISGLRDVTPKPPNTLHVEGSVGLTSEELVNVDVAKLTSLQWTPLTEIFAEGMRSALPKSKFLFWFVILEELEACSEFRAMFTPLFSDAEKTELMASNLTPEGKSRVSQLLSNIAATKEGRAQKLLITLQKIGLSQVQGLEGPIIIDEKICKSLITQRNNIAHKGKPIDKDQLYNVLFPLAQGALKYLEAK